MTPPPDFVVIGAMKCGTSTLHAQLARQPGLAMSSPKEPNFFSDDDVFARGPAWYASLFPALPDALRGESSTHYSKRPTFPHTVDRLAAHRPDARLIYVIRDPVDRLISQFIHEWSLGRICTGIDRAVRRHPELIHYSCYAMQLDPYLAAFGRSRVLCVFFERLRDDPQRELERIGAWLGLPGRFRWDPSIGAHNVSSDRLRISPIRDAIINAPVLADLRRRFVPQAVRDRVKRLWQMRRRPVLRPRTLRHVHAILNDDLARLSEWLGLTLTCESFATEARSHEPRWTETTAA